MPYRNPPMANRTLANDSVRRRLTFMFNGQIAPTALGLLAQRFAAALAEGKADQSAEFRAALAKPTRNTLGVKEAAFEFGCSRRHFNRLAPIVGVRSRGQWRIDESRFQLLLSALGGDRIHISADEIELWRLRASLIPARDIQPALERIFEIFERHIRTLTNHTSRIHAAFVAGGEEGLRREYFAVIAEIKRALRAELQSLAHTENHGRKIHVG